MSLRLSWMAMLFATFTAPACSPPPPAPPVARPAPPPPPSPPVPPPAPEPPRPAKQDVGVEVEYRVTPRDCSQIGEHLGELTAKELREKFTIDKLNDKQRAAAEREIEQTRKKAVDDWRQECAKLVGQVQERPNIDCALNAESNAALEACLGGPTPASPDP